MTVANNTDSEERSLSNRVTKTKYYIDHIPNINIVSNPCLYIYGVCACLLCLYFVSTSRSVREGVPATKRQEGEQEEDDSEERRAEPHL